MIGLIEEWEINVALFGKIEERPLNQTTQIYAIGQIAHTRRPRVRVRVTVKMKVRFLNGN